MTPTRSTTWSAARQRQALDLSARYRHGASVNQLALDTGLSKGTVINRLRLVGTPMRTPQQTLLLQADPEQTAARSELAATMRCWYESGTSVPDGQGRRDLRQTLRARYEAGASVQLLAAGCGYSTSTVYRLLHQAGTTMRPRSQPNPRTRGDRSPRAPLSPASPAHTPDAPPGTASSRSTSDTVNRIGTAS
jgi:transposase